MERVAAYEGSGNAAMRTYADAVSELWGELTKEEQEECKELADQWNKAPPPEDIQRK
jgi:hypothetical protein